MITYRPRNRRFALLLAVATVGCLGVVAPASAQFGGVVYDPSNYAQNLLTATRALQQVNNQITSLQNEASMLVNQARNLTSLPYSSLQQIQRSVQQTQRLLGEAQRIAYNVQNIDQAFRTQYGNASLTASDQDLVADARERWQNTVGGLQDAMWDGSGMNQNRLAILPGVTHYTMMNSPKLVEAALAFIDAQ